MLATAEKAPLQITNNVDLVSKNYERVYFRNFSCRQTAQHLGGIVYNSFFTMRNKSVFEIHFIFSMKPFSLDLKGCERSITDSDLAPTHNFMR